MAVVRIDAHHHFWNPDTFHYPWMEGDALDPVRRPFSPTDLAPELQANAIDGTVVVQTVSDVAETRQFLQTATETDWVRGVVGWVDLTDPAVGDTLDRLMETYPGLLVGIRHQVHDETDPDWLGRSDVLRGLTALAARGLTYDLLVRTRELPSAIATVRRLPELEFVLDHIAKPPIALGWDASWASGVSDLAANANVHVKLSGMVTEAGWDDWTASTLAPYITQILDVFGPNRAMFGSDWPVCLLAADDYEAVVSALDTNLIGLSDRERDAVFGLNAARFYKL